METDKEMTEHRIPFLTEEEWQGFYKFLKERGVTPEVQEVCVARGGMLYIPSLIATLLAEYQVVKDTREMGDFDVEVNWTELIGLRWLITVNLKNNMIVAEVGSWKGQSASVLATAVGNRGGKVFCIDHWRGSPATRTEERAKVEDVFLIFRENMRRLGLNEVVHPMIMNSEVALRIFGDESVDFAFIDGDHRYSEVKADVTGWYSKVKLGGILSGKACEGFYSEYPSKIKKMIDKSLEAEFTGGLHVGIIRALYDCFGHNYRIVPHSSIWYKQKTEQPRGRVRRAK